MKALIRTLMLWLVLLAVPFQGFASAAMPSCAPAAPAAKAAHDHQAMLAAKAVSKEHHSTALRASAHEATASSHDTGCSHCASCCLGAALAPATVVPMSVHHTVSFLTVPFDAGHVPSVDPEHPERPPRSARA